MQTNPIVPKRLPGLIALSHLFRMLFGTDTNCKSSKTPLALQECAIVASYQDNEGVIRRLLVCDLAFANSAGAALSAIPAATASQATKCGKIEDNFFDNLVEVMNVAVNLFTEAFGRRLELKHVQRISDLTADEIALFTSAQRVRFEIAIPRYDVGRVDLIAAAGADDVAH